MSEPRTARRPPAGPAAGVRRGVPPGLRARLPGGVAEATGQPVAPAATDECAAGSAPPAVRRRSLLGRRRGRADPRLIRLPEADAPVEQELGGGAAAVADGVRAGPAGLRRRAHPARHARRPARRAAATRRTTKATPSTSTRTATTGPTTPTTVYDEEDRGRPGWLVPALLGGLVLLLVLGAYGIGRVFSSSVDDADVSAEKPDGVVLGEDGDGAGGTAGDQPAGDGEPAPRSYQGRTETAVDRRGDRVLPGAGQRRRGRQQGRLPADQRLRRRPDHRLAVQRRPASAQALTLTLAEASASARSAWSRATPRPTRAAGSTATPRTTGSPGCGGPSPTARRWSSGSTARPPTAQLQTMRMPATQSDTVVLEVLASVRGPATPWRSARSGSAGRPSRRRPLRRLQDHRHRSVVDQGDLHVRPERRPARRSRRATPARRRPARRAAPRPGRARRRARSAAGPCGRRRTA